jgi:hypothetical protein
MSEKVISIPVGKIKDNPLALSSNAFERVDSWIEEGVTEEGSTEKKTVLNVRIVLQEGSKVITHDKAANEINPDQDTMNFHLNDNNYLIIDPISECKIDPNRLNNAQVSSDDQVNIIQKAKIYIALSAYGTYCFEDTQISKVVPNFKSGLDTLGKTQGTVGKTQGTVGSPIIP